MTSDNARHISLWDMTAPPPPETPPLEGAQSCDVAIVGGGFTGLSAALHLVEQGTNVIVVEAEKIGHGGSGRNAGLLNAGMWLDPEVVVERAGEEAGERINNVFIHAPAQVFDLIDRHGIECEATRTGTLYLATSEKARKKIAERGRQMNARGARMEILGKEVTAEKTGTEAYHACLLDPDAGTINPMGYVRGLAHAAQKAGARIHTGTPVTELERKGADWRVSTARGEVVAPNVILATNAYTDRLWPGLAREIYPLYYFQFATKPLSENLSKSILPERQGAWDSKKAMASFRFDAAGRLIVGSVGSIPQGGGWLRTRWAEYKLKQLFPHLPPVEWETQWMGRIAFTDDNLPHMHELAPGVLTCIGYNGRGIAPGTVMGKAMAHHLLGLADDGLPLPMSDVQPASFGAVRSAYYNIGAGLMQARQMLRKT